MHNTTQVDPLRRGRHLHRLRHRYGTGRVPASNAHGRFAFRGSLATPAADGAPQRHSRKETA